MKIKLTVLIAVVLVLTFVLSGYSLEIKSPENLMRPPKLTGGYQDLQDTFESVVGSNVNLLTPMNGDCKSAFIIGDFNSDSKEDAMVFYSSKDGDDVANISVFEKRDGVWTYLKTVAGLGNSVDTVVVEDLNGDSVKEIIVGWNLYSLNKQFSVYEPDSSDQANFFVSLGSYQYNLFSVTDINSDSNKEIFFVSLNTSDNIHSASAGVLGFEGGLMALNDRLKLRSMVVGEKDDMVYIASEEAAIRTMETNLDKIYAPAGGEPVIVKVKEGAF